MINKQTLITLVIIAVVAISVFIFKTNALLIGIIHLYPIMTLIIIGYMLYFHYKIRNKDDNKI